MSNLLINESPLVVLPSLAVAVGVDKALVLQQIQYWINQQGSGKNIGGEVWIWNTYSQWVTQFPFWTERKIMRLMTELKNDGLVKVKRFNRSNYDNTNFYTINLESLSKLVKTDTTPIGSINTTPEGSLNTTPSGSITATPGGSIYKGTETTTENTTENGFTLFWKDYPNKTNKEQAVKSWKRLTAKNKKLAHEKLNSFIVGLPEFQRPVKLHASTYLNNKRWEDESHSEQSSNQDAAWNGARI